MAKETELIVNGGMELAKFLVMLGIQEARRSGKSEEEVEAMYQESLMELLDNDPSKIPDVGKKV